MFLFFVQYVCSTRYKGPHFVGDSMSKHFPDAGDEFLFSIVNSLALSLAIKSWVQDG